MRAASHEENDDGWCGTKRQDVGDREKRMLREHERGFSSVASTSLGVSGVVKEANALERGPHVRGIGLRLEEHLHFLGRPERDDDAIALCACSGKIAGGICDYERTLAVSRPLGGKIDAVNHG